VDPPRNRRRRSWSREELRLGIAKDPAALLHDADEGSCRTLPVDLQSPCHRARSSRRRARSRDSSHELDRGHRQIDAWPMAAQRELLLGLRRVRWPTGRNDRTTPARSDVRVLRRLAPPRSSRPCTRQRSVASDRRIGGEEWQRARIVRSRAPGARHALGAADLVAMELRDAIDQRPSAFGCGCGSPYHVL